MNESDGAKLSKLFSRTAFDFDSVLVIEYANDVAFFFAFDKSRTIELFAVK